MRLPTDPLRFPDLTRRGIVFDVTTAALFGLVTIAIHAAVQGRFVAVAGGLIAVALGLRRVAPSVAMTIAVVSAVMQVAAVDIAMFACLGYIPLFYTAASHPHRKVRMGSLVAAVVGSVVAGWTLPAVNDFVESGQTSRLHSTALFSVLTAGLLLPAWAFGFIGYQRRATEKARVDTQIAELERRRTLDLFDQEAERNRIARDMHDIVAHSLAVVVAQAEGARYAFDTSPDSARSALEVIAGTGRTALSDVRTLLEQLRHTDADAAAGDQHARRDDLLTRMRAAGMTIDVTETGSPDGASPMVTTTAHRMLTEVLTNALKHGDCSEPVLVEQHWDGGFSMKVTNRVSDEVSTLGGTGHGIAGMSERATLAGGTMSSHADGAGHWIVTATVPRSGTELTVSDSTEPVA